MTVHEADDKDIIKIMVTTDNHVGYLENDPVRGQDALNTFREALQVAQEEQVDMILIAGDLFHENKPSNNALHQVMGALREYTMGNRPLALAYVSDPKESAHPKYKFGAVNYMEEYYNVSIPVFAIHGNHDDRQGFGPDGPLSALDLLSTAGLVNYLGKNNLPLGSTSRRTEDQHIDVRPALLQKGNTKLALYGLGNLKDERLAMELRMRRVRMFQPVDETDSYFNLLALHQNRSDRGKRTVVPEGAFDNSIDLVIWGHEHEQRTEPEAVPQKNYRICQPGSTVITSLSQGEEAPKSVAILKIAGKDYTIERRPLQTVRPFIIEDFDLEEELDERGIVLGEDRSQKQVLTMLEAKIESLIEKATEQWVERQQELGTSEEEVTQMPLPLIRLRVNFEKHEVGNLVRFGTKFVGRVANPKDVLGFNRKRAAKKQQHDHGPEFVQPDEMEMGVVERLEKLNIDRMVSSVVQGQVFEGLPGLVLDQGLQTLVEKDVKGALRDVMQQSLKRQAKAAEGQIHALDEIEDTLQESYQAETSLAQDRYRHYGSRTGSRAESMDVDDDRSPSSARTARATSPRGMTRVSGSRGGRAGSRTQWEPTVEEDEEEEDEEDEEPPPRAPARAPTRAPARASARAPARPAAASRGLREPEPMDYEEQDEPAPLARTTRTRTRPASRQNYTEGEADEADSGNDDDDQPAYELSQGDLFRETQASQEFEDDDDDDDDELEEVVTRGTKRRAPMHTAAPTAKAPKRATTTTTTTTTSRGGHQPTLEMSQPSTSGGPRARALAGLGSTSRAPTRNAGVARRPAPSGSDSDEVEFVGASQAPPTQSQSQVGARARRRF